MKIGFVGLGKLGLPCALAIDSVGEHEVVGYDVDENIKTYLDKKAIPYREKDADKYLEDHNVKFLPIDEVVEFSDIIFVPIQTPHDPFYDGVTRLPNTRVDFDYSF